MPALPLGERLGEGLSHNVGLFRIHLSGSGGAKCL
ncbi:MAG: hypothetical protein QOH71_2623 [Blastocatellia bacterium]|jgi:hypothetical protein|nr:hypothetical protein [Blastocatellia bacterium]